MNKVFSPQELYDLGKRVAEAADDPTPFATYAGDLDEVSIIGDSSQSYPKKTFDFVATFRFFKDKFIEKFGSIPEDAQTTKNFVVIKVKYEDIAITPRNDSQLVSQIFDLITYIEQEQEIANQYKEELHKLEEQFNVQFLTEEKEGLTLPTTKNPEKDKEVIKKAQELQSKMLKDTLEMYAFQSDKAQLALYRFVGILLGIDDDDMLAHMTSFSVLEILIACIQKYPEFFNEADTVFGF